MSTADDLQDPRGPLRRWWERAQWPVVWVAAAVAFVLGFIGFQQHPGFPAVSHDWLDYAYLSLQLFVLQSGAVEPSPGWQLGLARFLAPGVAVYTATSALLILFRDQLTGLRLRFLRGHALVVGLGRAGRLLAQQFRAERPVVVVERDPSNEWVRNPPRGRMLLVPGGATERGVLDRLRPERARYLFAVTGDDEANIEFALRARERARRRGQRRPLDCFVHVVDPRLAALLLEREVGLVGPDAVRVEFFSLYDAGARALLEELTETRARRNEREPLRQLIVVGLGRLGEHVVAHAAREQWANRSVLPVRLTLVDRAATGRRDALARRYPRLAEACTVDAFDLEIEEPAFEQADFVDWTAPVGTVAVCVCVDDDALALTAALLLARRLRERRAPVIVRSIADSGFGAALRSARDEGVIPFDLLARTCRKDIILRGVHETVAQALHADYLDTQWRLGQSPVANPAMVSWDELPDQLRESNRRQARHIAAKLEAVRCGITIQSDWGEPPLVFTAPEIDRLAELEHERWREERSAEGWRLTSGAKDLERKRSPYLVAWTDLEEGVRETNRALVRGLPEVLARVGFRVYRRLEA